MWLADSNSFQEGEKNGLNYSPGVKEEKKKNKAESHFETREAKQSEFPKVKGQRSICRPRKRSQSP